MAWYTLFTRQKVRGFVKIKWLVLKSLTASESQPKRSSRPLESGERPASPCHLLVCSGIVAVTVAMTNPFACVFML
jgi:hypothetical protein